MTNEVLQEQIRRNVAEHTVLSPAIIKIDKPLKTEETKMTNNDLISRNALIQHAFTAEFDGKPIDVVALSDIDNAPTVTIDNYAMGYQDGVRKVLSELSERGYEMGNIFGDYKPTLVAYSEENKNE